MICATKTRLNNPASVRRMPAATMPSTGRRYRGLSAEERRADQRGASCAPRSTSSRHAGITARRSKTSCAARARAAPRSTRSSTTARPRCTARCKTSLRGLLDAVRNGLRARRARHEPHRGRRHRVRRLPRRRSRGGAHHLARGHRHVARGQRAAQPGPPRGRRRRCATSGPSTTPRPRRRPRPPRSRSACSASCSSRCCTSWRAAGSTRRPSHVPALVTAVERMLASRG